MPFLAYVHSREWDPPPGPGGRRSWEPDWRLWRWLIATAVFAFTASYSTGLFELVMVLAAFTCACRAAVVLLPGEDGLREYRQ